MKKYVFFLLIAAAVVGFVFFKSSDLGRQSESHNDRGASA